MGDARGGVPETDARAEILAAIAMLDRVEGVNVKALGDRMRARLVALDGAPAGAGWEWLAAQGDRGAQAVVDFERGRR